MIFSLFFQSILSAGFLIVTNDKAPLSSLNRDLELRSFFSDLKVYYTSQPLTGSLQFSDDWLYVEEEQDKQLYLLKYNPHELFTQEQWQEEMENLFMNREEEFKWATPDSFLIFAKEAPKDLPKMTEVLPLPDFALDEDEENKALPKDHLINQRIKTVDHDDYLASILENTITEENLKKDVQFLTGEDEQSFIKTRHASSSTIWNVAQWVQKRMQENGCQQVQFFNFSSRYGPDVVCTFPGHKDASKVIIVGAHYDDRNSNMYFPNSRAPGADDDGSGSSAILNAIKVFSQLKLEYTVQVIAFCAEEQGLYGSKAYAQYVKKHNINLQAMIQNDMLAYHKPGEPFQVGFPDPSLGTPELNDFLWKVTGLYTPQLERGYTRACCSDHLYFKELGYPGTQFFERHGPIADPMYHNVKDLSERTGYDFEQLRLLTTAMTASVASLAGYERPARLVLQN